MIVFKSVQWSNFLSTGNSPNKVILNENSSTLIVGKNGEGKSTMLDAVCFALFGKPFRNINKNQLINSINKKNCSVEVEFTSNNREYKVIRGIRPNVFEIWCDDQLVNKDAALKDYQKVLEQQILKLNYKTFTQVVILGSSNFVPFMQLPSSQRREVIEDILDIRIFTLMNQLLKQKAADSKDELFKLNAEISAEKVKIEAQQKLIETLVSAKHDIVNGLKKKVETNKTTILETTENIKKNREKIDNLKNQKSDYEEVNENLDKAKVLKTNISQKVNTFENEKEFFIDNETCPSCTQPISIKHKTKVVTELDKKIKDHNVKLQLLEEGLKKLEVRLNKIAEINDKITDISIEISTMNNTVSILNDQNQELIAEIEGVSLDKSNIDDEKASMKKMAEQAVEKIKAKTSLLEEKKIQDIAAVLLKDTGIKTAIIKEYLPAMNKLINKYLNTMDFYVSFELDEAFNETIKSRHRDEFTYASFSEGEKQKIDLALLFAWREIARMKNSVNTNLLILDEVFDSSLDNTATEYLLSIINSLGENINIFVISHKIDTLMDKFKNTIRFEKKNEFSIMKEE
jgi:DNA repair exonuclease SbcCD ATPase subunit